MRDLSARRRYASEQPPQAALSESQRECTTMPVTAQKFQSQKEPVSKPLAWSNHRTTLPQSRPLGVTAPSEREPGGLHHSRGCSLKSGVTGDFHRPYETQKPFPFTIQRTTLPQSASLTAPSEREPGEHTMPRGAEPLHFAIHDVTKVTQNPTYRVRGHRRCQYGGWANYRAVLPPG